MDSTRHIEVHRLGRIDYATGLEWQARAVEAVRGGALERVALLEHAPVYTLGARGHRGSLRVAEAELPAPLVHSDRGGDITFHGPGQLVAYPVLDVRARRLRAGDYVRALEECVIEALAGLGVAGERWAGRPGVWARSEGSLEKMAAIGVRVQDGVTRHGLALNVSTDLRWFEAIIPCGIEDAGITSLERVLGAAPSPLSVEQALLGAFGCVFDSDLVAAAPAVEVARA